MPNIAQVLKTEIQRLAKKEVKQAVSTLKKDTASLKKQSPNRPVNLQPLKRKQAVR